MTKVGLLSDTHSFFDPKFEKLFADCDEIWHAGDIGDIKVIDEIKKLKPLKAVFGNIDDATIRTCVPQDAFFTCDGVSVFMTHIGGYPGKYDKSAYAKLLQNKPKLFICGHSHILKVIYDKKLDCLHINPGAAGRSGFHSVRTAVRFELHEGNIQNLEIIELNKEQNTNQI